ncbi:uncharacterized protein LOC142777107 [Rhipicephalus microplus]|uniref:uncharacterized protein LOC142777107 n=1 Tax=Rhipicephalus microplus TaxID=6941 RepID=UPI003F6D4F03
MGEEHWEPVDAADSLGSPPSPPRQEPVDVAEREESLPNLSQQEPMDVADSQETLPDPSQQHPLEKLELIAEATNHPKNLVPCAIYDTSFCRAFLKNASMAKQRFERAARQWNPINHASSARCISVDMTGDTFVPFPWLLTQCSIHQSTHIMHFITC